MNFTAEQLAKAKSAKSVEELLAFAKENEYPLTEEEAKSYFEKWHTEGELSDEELENATGGGPMVSCSASYGVRTNGYWFTDYPPYYMIVSEIGHCRGFLDPVTASLMPDANTSGLGVPGSCRDGVHFEFSGGVSYCKIRTQENDPYMD